MRISKLFTKTKKEITKEETALNAKLLLRAGYINKEMAGVYSYLPLGIRVINKIANIVREEMNNSLGAQEVFMPALHPLKNYELTGRDKIDVLFYTKLNGGGDLVMGQSHEEIVVPLFKQFASSYKDLPCGIYQIQSKFRNELRAKSGILRGREFLMKDLYSFHLTKECFEEYYKKAQKVYADIYKRLGIGDKTYLTFASGGTFSKYSHEFQMLSDVGEDEIYLCRDCRVAVNKEIIKDVEGCPECNKPVKNLEIKRAIEVGNIFPLATRFSEAFDLKIKDEKGKEVFPIMGCYGIGISRVMGSIVEISNDENGIIWPEEVSPFDVHLVGLNLDKKEVKDFTEEVYKKLQEEGVTILFDDREDVSSGFKLKDADLIGISKQIIVSEKLFEKSMVEYKERINSKIEEMSLKQAIDKIL